MKPEPADRPPATADAARTTLVRPRRNDVPPPDVGHIRRAWASASLLLALYAAFGLTHTGSSLDQSVRTARDDTATGLLWLAHHLLAAVNPVTVTMSTVVVIGLAWRRRGTRAGAETALGIVFALGLAESMKLWLPMLSHRPGAHLVLGGSFPSGHVAVTTALVLGFLNVLPPRRLRWFAIPAVALTAGTALSTIAVGWHRPSDAIGGLLVAVVTHHGVRAVARSRRLGAFFSPPQPSDSVPLRPYGGQEANPVGSHGRASFTRSARRVMSSTGALLAAGILSMLAHPGGSPDSWHERSVWLYAAGVVVVVIAVQIVVAREVERLASAHSHGRPSGRSAASHHGSGPCQQHRVMVVSAPPNRGGPHQGGGAMRRISHKKIIVTALAVGSLGVLGAAGVAQAATNPAPSPTSSSSAPALSTGGGTTGADQREGPRDEADSGVESTKEANEPAETTGSEASEAKKAPEAPEAKGQDTDQVQQGDQTGPDTPAPATPGPVQ